MERKQTLIFLVSCLLIFSGVLTLIMEFPNESLEVELWVKVIGLLLFIGGSLLFKYKFLKE